MTKIAIPSEFIFQVPARGIESDKFLKNGDFRCALAKNTKKRRFFL